MKKGKLNLAVLPLLALLLTGCNKNGVTDLPNKGEEITVTEGRNQFKQAYLANITPVDDVSAIGVKRSNISFGINGERTTTQDSAATGIKAKAELSDAALEFAAKGFAGTKTDDLELYAKAAGKLSYSMAVTSSYLGTNQTTSAADTRSLNIETHVLHDKTYLDTTGSDLGNLSKGDGLGGRTITRPVGKFYTASPFASVTDERMPIISADNTDSDFIDYDKVNEIVTARTDKGVFKSHGNDIYSYSYTLTGQDIRDFVIDSIKKAQEGQNQQVSDEQFGQFRKILSVDKDSKISYAVVFSSKTGIQSIGEEFSFKVGLDTTSISGQGMTTPLMKGSFDAHASYKLDFTRGKDVVIPELTDKGSYSELAMSE